MAARRPTPLAFAPELRRGARVVAVFGAAEAVATVAQAVLLAMLIAVGVEGVPDRGRLPLLLGALVVAVLARTALSTSGELVGRRAGRRAVTALRSRIVDATLVSAGSGDRRPGVLAANAVHGTDAVATFAGRYLPQRVVAGVAPVIALAVVAAVDWISAAVLLIAIAVAIIFLILVGIRAKAAADHRHAALELLDGHLLDVLRGLRVLRAHRRERFQVDQVRAAGEAYRGGTMAVLKEAFLSSFVLEMVAMLGTALVAVACGIRLVGGHMGFSAAIIALVVAPEVFTPLRKLGAEYHAAADAEPVLRVLSDAAGTSVSVPTGTIGAPAADPGTDDIVLTAVGTASGDRSRSALSDVDVTIPAGTVTGLVGPSGAGKTTLLRLLAALREPETGAITCGGRRLADVDLAHWRDRVAWVPQHPALLPASLAENVRFGRADIDESSIVAALDAVGLMALVRALPLGLQTPLGDGGLGLSAGERRRVGLARAIVHDPHLVLVDEPTANLDHLARTQVIAALRHLVAGRTAVISTHDPAPLVLVDRTIAISEGRVMTPDDGGTPQAPFTDVPIDLVETRA